MNNRTVNAWAISYGLRRFHADVRQMHESILFPIVRTQENVNSTPSRLPFDVETRAPKTQGFYWTYDKCVFDDGVMRYFIRNAAGLPLDSAETEAEANEKVDALNNPTPRDAGVRRFATGSKYAIKANGNG